MTEATRALAARTLTEAGVSRLPVRLGEIARLHGVRLFTYSEYAKAAGVGLGEVVARYGVDGFTQRFGEVTAVFYREGGNPKRMRWTIAHELAHLILGHLDGRVVDNPDREADALAAEILCPGAVVSACHCTDSTAIARLCDISVTAARLRGRAVVGVQTDEERRLLEQCRAFVAERRSVDDAGELLPRTRRNRI